MDLKSVLIENTGCKSLKGKEMVGESMIELSYTVTNVFPFSRPCSLRIMGSYIDRTTFDIYFYLYTPRHIEFNNRLAGCYLFQKRFQK